MIEDTVMDDALANASSATSYRLSRGLASAFPGKAILETDEGEFDPWRFGKEEQCEVLLARGAHSQLERGLSRATGTIWTRAENAFLDVRWNGHALTVVRAEWKQAYSNLHRVWVVAETMDVAEQFFTTVTDWCHAPRREILVFNGGCWSRSRDLYEAVSRASFEDLILAGSLKEEIRRDFESFMKARADYEKYGVPWKRGVLLVGPPGNGKTHCLRAVVKFLDVPCLYVQSFKAHYETDDANILKVFQEARTHTPCCLVFEDLDAMITPQNRSYFLNQLDGFSENPGVFTVATTNHPERLDPAIVSRPSRFDRKYHFDLPATSERLAYVAMWNRRFEASMRLPEEALEGVAGKTDGFSFAYLKELFVSSMVRWMARCEPGSMPSIIDEQLVQLRDQMASELSAPAKGAGDALPLGVAEVMASLLAR